MVFFSCDGCGEMLKKNQVDGHVYKCKRGCHSVSCVDCSVSFYDDDYRSHTSCITEAERYEKKTPTTTTSSSRKNSNHHPPKRRNPQQEWMDIVMTCSKNDTSLPPKVQSYLHAVAQLDNVPRKEKQFINFINNSFGGRQDNLFNISHQLWKILQQERDRRRECNTNVMTMMDQTKPQQQGAEGKELPSSTASGTNETQPATVLDGTDINHPQTKKMTTMNNKQQTLPNGPSTTTPIKDVQENVPTTNMMITTMDTKKVKKAVKKVLKSTPNHSMTVKALRKILIRDYGIVVPSNTTTASTTSLSSSSSSSLSIKKQLRHIINSYHKVKIHGKTVTLLLNNQQSTTTTTMTTTS